MTRGPPKAASAPTSGPRHPARPQRPSAGLVRCDAVDGAAAGDRRYRRVYAAAAQLTPNSARRAVDPSARHINM
ncbi:hypothetical protein EVAR_91472_1 [Eumeta japonica]|uniref:Uncharacterized protein n=1 Tax=Eumeta variegata TaxID=151549 RepID=A0A4C1VAQ9_EUMVA|nr:hypothetical protein EVAR_91472_1 [Eumeta japonica]